LAKNTKQPSLADVLAMGTGLIQRSFLNRWTRSRWVCLLSIPSY